MANRDRWCAVRTLRLLSTVSMGDEPGLNDWNKENGWRRYYDGLTTPTLFFAQDIFAAQFGLTDRAVVRLDPETGEVASHSGSLEQWAEKILDGYNVETGWGLAREWQRTYGPLKRGYRLLPKTPFVLGGDYVIENLVAVPSAYGLEKWGQFYTQTKATKEGTRVTVKGWIDPDK